MTLQHKILLFISSLALLIIAGMSGVYYSLFSDYIQEDSRNQITLAFEYILQDIATQIQNLTKQAEHFTRSSLAGTLYRVELSRERYQEWDVREVRKILHYLEDISKVTAQFGQLIEASQTLIYNQNGSLLAVYQQTTEPMTTGVYLPEVFAGQFIPIKAEADWPAKLTTLEEIPQQTFPPYIFPTYHNVIPNASEFSLSIFEGQLTIRLLVPIIEKDKVLGLCLIQIPIQQQDIERYARLSKTQVNIFAGKDWSVGTLPEFQQFPEAFMDTLIPLDRQHLSASPEPAYSEAITQNHAYYQGTLVIGSIQELLGAITVYLPRTIEEEQRQKFFLALTLIFLVFAAITAVGALFLSGLIVKPIKKLTGLIRQIARGDFREIDMYQEHLLNRGNHHSKDEIVQLLVSFRCMTHYLREMAAIADQISRGEISLEFAPRSEHDLLGNAFAGMADYLNKIAAVATAVSGGDLRHDMSPNTEHDVLGHAFHRMGLLRQTMQEIMSEAEHLDQGAGELKQISARLASGSLETVERVQSISANSAQMNKSITEISTAAMQMADSIQEISGHTKTVAQEVGTAVNVSKTAGTAIRELEKRSKEIGNIINVITTITQQTNLLALNAAIEATRAGEKGKGFAVVAGEVKNLASETAKSAEDIISKVKAIQTSSHETAAAINEMSKIIKQVQSFTDIIVSAISKQTATTQMINRNITGAAHETEEMSHAIFEMANTAQISSELASKVQQSAECQSVISKKLSSLVNRFKI